MCIRDRYILNRTMIRPAALLAFVCAISAVAAQPRAPLAARAALPASAAESPRFAPIAVLVREAIAEHQLPGAVVLIGRGDAVLYAQAFGQRAILPEPKPMTEDTIFDLASLTKVV